MANENNSEMQGCDQQNRSEVEREINNGPSNSTLETQGLCNEETAVNNLQTDRSSQAAANVENTGKNLTNV